MASLYATKAYGHKPFVRLFCLDDKKKLKTTLCRKLCVFSGYSGFYPRGKLTG